MTIDHRYSSRTFLAVTVQSKVAGVKLVKHALPMGQVEAASEMSEHGWEMLCFIASQRLVKAFLTVNIFHLIIVLYK